MEQDGGGARRRLSSNKGESRRSEQGRLWQPHKDKTPRKAGWEPSAREPSPTYTPQGYAPTALPQDFGGCLNLGCLFPRRGFKVHTSFSMLQGMVVSLPMPLIPAFLPTGSIQ